MSNQKTLKGVGWIAASLLMVLGILVYYETVPQYARKHSRLFIHVTAEEARRKRLREWEQQQPNLDLGDIWMRGPRR